MEPPPPLSSVRSLLLLLLLVLLPLVLLPLHGAERLLLVPGAHGGCLVLCWATQSRAHAGVVSAAVIRAAAATTGGEPASWQLLRGGHVLRAAAVLQSSA